MIARPNTPIVGIPLCTPTRPSYDGADDDDDDGADDDAGDDDDKDDDDDDELASTLVETEY